MASSWLIARQVREAIRSDRPDEAHRLLSPLMESGHRKAWRLAREIAGAHIARAERFLRQDQPEAAWGELLAAEGLNTGDSRAAALRQTLTRYGLTVIRAALEAGKPLAAVEQAERLQQRGVRHPDLKPLHEVAEDWFLATDAAERGDFAFAELQLQRVRPRLTTPTAALDTFTGELQSRSEQFRQATRELQAAITTHRWRDAIRAADDALAVAPARQEVRRLRRTAWEQLQPGSTPDSESLRLSGIGHEESDARTATRTQSPAVVLARLAPAGDDAPHRLRALHDSPTTAYVSTLPDDEPPLRRLGPESRAPSGPFSGVTPIGNSSRAASVPKRFLLWVNNAGGYLVCLSPRVTFGQGIVDGPVDVPLLADVSRFHAELSRDAEGYVLESQREVAVNGRAVTRAHLKPGDRVTLGPACQFLFHMPTAVSPSARLEFVSGHHFPLAVNSVLLMADNLIFGPEATAHVHLPGVRKSAVLFRGREGLGVAVPGAFRVENEPCTDRAAVPLPGWVHGPDFGFGIEALPAR